MKGTVLLVEDEEDARASLARSLERAGWRCVAAASAAGALAVARRGEEALTMVVTDIVLGPGDAEGGLRLLSDLRSAGVRAPIVVITAHADVEKVKTALNEGAAHLLEKPFRAADLIAALDRVAARAKSPAPELFAKAGLTEKETMVAHHLLAGLSSGEIADLEGNSPKTIRQHVTQIYAKLGVGSRAELFALVFAPRVG
jgi:DNA-binding NarL/FixJ family response regulator